MSRTENISDMRRNYEQGNLDRADLADDPFKQFANWFETAVSRDQSKPAAEANAMTLATADKNGRPSARIVLLKGFDENGFVFYSHYEGAKGRELAENPQAALVFHWADLERQVNVGGTVERISRAESEAYFRTRPRGSRLAVWVARQSDVVPDRKFLEQKWREAEAKFPGDVPLPEHWGGYRLVPDRVEFWQGRPSRLHDRFLYSKNETGKWKIERLAP